MDSHAFLVNALIFLGVAVLAVPLFKRIGLGSILGYLAAGALIGPWGFKFITDPQSIMQFSELGVVFLLFVIGLELNPRRLWVMRKNVFGLGAAQVGATGLIAALVSYFAGLSMGPAIIIGLSFSLSSTAFALQILGERKQLNTAFGRASFGILLFQDLAAIPLIAIVPLLSATSAPEHGWFWDIARVMGIIAGLVVGGRFLLQPLLRAVAAAKTQEIFTAAALLLVLGVALLMESAGLSMALGSFLAGVLLAESEHRHELEADIEPFKGLLLGLFFISVGMAVDFGLLLSRPFFIVGLVLALLIGKAGLIFGIGRLFGMKSADARTMAATIAQGGEFAFVLFGTAVASRVLEKPTADMLTLIVSISMACTPLMVYLDETYRRWCGEAERAPYDLIVDEENPVIIAGFGRFGQIVGRILRVRKIGFTALEADQQQVNVLRKFGNKVFYGDASRIELLTAAGAAKARYFVLAIDNIESSLKTAAIVRQHFPQLKIFARARNRQHAYELMALGVTIIHRETLDTSLELTRSLLVDLGFEEEDAKETIVKFKRHDEKMLLEQFKVKDDEKELINYSKQYAQQLADLFSSDQISQ